MHHLLRYRYKSDYDVIVRVIMIIRLGPLVEQWTGNP